MSDNLNYKSKENLTKLDSIIKEEIKDVSKKIENNTTNAETLYFKNILLNYTNHPEIVNAHILGFEFRRRIINKLSDEKRIKEDEKQSYSLAAKICLLATFIAGPAILSIPGIGIPTFYFVAAYTYTRFTKSLKINREQYNIQNRINYLLNQNTKQLELASCMNNNELNEFARKYN